MNKSTATQAPTDPASTTPTVPPTAPTEPESAQLKGYAVKVGKDSPVSTVRSAGIVFTAEAQFVALDHPALAELRRNPWLETSEVTE